MFILRTLFLVYVPFFKKVRKESLLKIIQSLTLKLNNLVNNSKNLVAT